MSCLGSTKAQLATFDGWRGKTWPWPVSEATGGPEESAAPSLARSVAGRPGKEELYVSFCWRSEAFLAERQ